MQDLQTLRRHYVRVQSLAKSQSASRSLLLTQQQTMANSSTSSSNVNPVSHQQQGQTTVDSATRSSYVTLVSNPKQPTSVRSASTSSSLSHKPPRQPSHTICVRCQKSLPDRTSTATNPQQGVVRHCEECRDVIQIEQAVATITTAESGENMPSSRTPDVVTDNARIVEVTRAEQNSAKRPRLSQGADGNTTTQETAPGITSSGLKLNPISGLMEVALTENEEFDSFSEFKHRLEAYSKQNNILFIIGDSGTVEAANKRLAASTSKRFDAKLTYKHIKYICKHGSKTRKRTDVKKRPNQRYQWLSFHLENTRQQCWF